MIIINIRLNLIQIYYLNNKRQEQVGAGITSCQIFYWEDVFCTMLSSHLCPQCFLVGDPEFKGVGV
jgi:hypothetical protein